MDHAEKERERKVSGEIILETRGLDAGYGGKAVVRDVELRLHAGEILVLIGPNGTGKSTILRTLCGQLPPVAGKVLLHGRDLRTMRENEIARSVSLLMTDRTDPELMTCGEVVSIGRYPYTGVLGRMSSRDKEAADAAMELAHVSELRDRLFSRVSDGQRQRVLLAKAICQEPEVLIMDEPTSYLDIRHRLEFMQILLKLVRERGTAAAVSLHETETARLLADTVVSVSGGRAGCPASPEEALREEEICRLFDITEEQYRWLYGTRGVRVNSGEAGRSGGSPEAEGELR